MMGLIITQRLLIIPTHSLYITVDEDGCVLRCVLLLLLLLLVDML